MTRHTLKITVEFDKATEDHHFVPSAIFVLGCKSNVAAMIAAIGRQFNAEMHSYKVEADGPQKVVPL